MAKELECGRVLATHAQKQQVDHSLCSSLLLCWGCDLPGLRRNIIYRQVRLIFTELYTQHLSRFTLLNKRVIEIVFNKLKLKHRNYRLINNEEETIL